MDGISAASAVIQVVAVSLALSQKIATFLIDAHDVVETRNSLFDQVKCLHSTVCAVHALLSRRKLQMDAKPVCDEEYDIFKQTQETLLKTEETISWLEMKLEKLGGGREQPRCWEKAWMQMKVQVRTPAIAKIERQIQTSVSSLQLMLQCMNPFIHEDTQAAVQTGFEATNAALIKIQSTMEDLRRLIQQPLHFADPAAIVLDGVSEDTIRKVDSAVVLDDISDQAPDMAHKCLSAASSLCGKLSQPGTYVGSARQTTLGLDDVSLTGNISNRSTYIVDSELEEAKGTTKTAENERLEVMTTHIANDFDMAMAAIHAEDYPTARNHIIEAIDTAEEREAVYNFPFEDETAFQETYAYILRRIGDLTEAKSIYIKLLINAEVSHSDEAEGRLCFGLAHVYQDMFAGNFLDKEDVRFFEDWKNYALRAYESALRNPERPDSDAPWRSHPSLQQTAEMLSEMYECWEKPAKAMTYRQRHPSTSETNVSGTISWSPPSMAAVPPTPPSSDEQQQHQKASSEGTTEDNVFFDNLSHLISKNFTASGLLVLHKIEKNDYEATKFFLDLAQGSVDMEQKNDRGLTPLLLAVHKRHTKIVRLLLEHERSPNLRAKDKNGWTVLHYALSGYDDKEMVDLLVKHGADVNTPSADGTTPLHCAVNNNKLYCAELLLRHQASTEVKDTAGRSPMYIAVTKKRHDMVGVLLKHGAVCDREAFLKENRDLEDFFEECEYNGILAPPPKQQQRLDPHQHQEPARRHSEQSRRPSALSFSKKRSIFRRSRHSSGSGDGDEL